MITTIEKQQFQTRRRQRRQRQSSGTTIRLIFLISLSLILFSLDFLGTTTASAAGEGATSTTNKSLNNDADPASPNADSSENACYHWGCPYLPRDVFYDESAKTALHRLKEPTRKLHEDETIQNNKASMKFLSELDSSGDRHRTTMTLCGYKGGPIKSQINQDRSILVSPFLNEYQILGVLDGHGTGGEIVSEYARQQIPMQISDKLKEIVQESNGKDSTLMNPNEETTQKVVQALKEIFINIDKNAPKESEMGGCTASIALQLGNKLFVANAGDSVTIVGAHRAWNESNTVVYTSREDKPHLPEERKRIEKAGGRVQLPTKFAGDDDTSRIIYKDRKTKIDVGLAMSRSIGDWDAPGCTAEPIVDVLHLDQVAKEILSRKEEYDCNKSDLECGPPIVNFMVISATDGLMDFVKPQAIVDKVGITFFGRPSLQDRQSGVGSGHAHLAAEELIYLAARGWHESMQGSYRDDITVAATKVFPWEEEEEEATPGEAAKS